MATISAVFALTDATPTSGTIGATSSTGEIVLGSGSLWGFVSNADAHIRVGTAGLGASSTAYFRIPANILFTLEMNRSLGSIRLYNPTGSTSTYHLVPLFRS